MLKRVIPAALGLALSLPAVAVNWGFLEDAPVARFTDRDWALMEETSQKALDEAADGETHGWNNPESGAFGKTPRIVEKLSTIDGVLRVRDARIINLLDA